jgi:drug/metabolite transporter (DMT)-like permease
VSAIALALLSALLFGAATPASKRLLEALTPLQLSGLLYLGAAAAMLPLAARGRGGPRVDRANRLRLAGAILAGGLVGPLLLLLALRLAQAGSVSLLLNFELAATAVLGAAFFREHVGRGGWLGVAGIAAAGGLLSAEGGWPGAAAALLVLGACVAWGLDNHWTARIEGMTPARAVLWKGAGAGSASLALGLAAAPLAATGTQIGAALAVGALAYGASIALYVAAAQQLGATRAQGVFACAPFLGAALSALWLGERPGPAHALAAAILAASVAVLLGSRHAHWHSHTALEHLHSHRHDDGHHLHPHPGLPPSTRHSHPHRHEPLAHAHPHWPDLHHCHEHGDVGREVD